MDNSYIGSAGIRWSDITLTEGMVLPEIIPSLIVKHPESITVDSGETVQFSVAAKGKNGYEYRCEMKGLDGVLYYTDIVTLTIG